jgi:hypothetical protein
MAVSSTQCHLSQSGRRTSADDTTDTGDEPTPFILSCFTASSFASSEAKCMPSRTVFTGSSRLFDPRRRSYQA